MSKSESAFKVFIRIVFLFAYGAFLWASLHHIAFFFHSFEQDGNNWGGSYALAISIDVTALVLTIGVMFFRKGMARHSLVFVWVFIFALTGFSWLVNWEYAVQFQGDGLSKAWMLQQVNPILASAFAFLNLAYSVIAEFFNDKPKTLGELQAELTQLQSIKGIQEQLKAAKKGQGLVATFTEKAKELQQAKQDIFGQSFPKVSQKSERTSGELDPKVIENIPELLTKDEENFETSFQEDVPDHLTEVDTNPELPTPTPQEENRRKNVMTFEEASAYTGYTPSYLKGQVSKGEIQQGKGGKLLVRSLKVKGGATSKAVA